MFVVVASSHGATCTTIDAQRGDADIPASAAVETGRSEVFLGDLRRAWDVSEGRGDDGRQFLTAQRVIEDARAKILTPVG